MKSENINELAVALAKAQFEMRNPEKNKTVKIQMRSGRELEFSYADLGALREASKEALHTNDLSIVHLVNAKESVLETKLMHSSGQWISSQFPLPPVQDIKVFAGEITYAKRYNKAALLDLFADDDNDAGESKAVSKEKRVDTAWKSPNEIKSPTAFQVAPSAASSSYVIPLKKFAGKKLSEVPDFEILNYVDWIKREGITKPDFLEFIKQGESYLKSIQKNPQNIPDTIQDDIPDWVKNS